MAVARISNLVYLQKYLRRPPAKNQEWRLDRLLKRKAEQGIKIYLFLYKEIEAALTIASLYSKMKLREMHENIVCQRHPDHIPGATATYLWAVTLFINQ